MIHGIIGKVEGWEQIPGLDELFLGDDTVDLFTTKGFSFHATVKETHDGKSIFVSIACVRSLREDLSDEEHDELLSMVAPGFIQDFFGDKYEFFRFDRKPCRSYHISEPIKEH